MNNPLTFTSIAGENVTLDEGWLLMYEGSYYSINPNRSQLENDVWASGDEGQTWDLISGISRSGYSGTVVQAAVPYNMLSFTPREGSNNCEDPSSDDVYSLGGFVEHPVYGYKVSTNDVWFSQSGLEWFKLTTSFTPGRWSSSCDVTTESHVLMMGGQLGASGISGSSDGEGGQMLNDVWGAEQNSFKRQTDRAPWTARGEHLVLVGNSKRLNAELVYVMGRCGIHRYHQSEEQRVRQRRMGVVGRGSLLVSRHGQGAVGSAVRAHWSDHGGRSAVGDWRLSERARRLPAGA